MNYNKNKWVSLLWAFVISAGVFAQDIESDNRITSEYIIMLKPGQAVGNLQESFPQLTIEKNLSPRMNIWLVKSVSQQEPEALLTNIKRHASVKLAQFNHRIQERAMVPNDPFFGNLWGMLNTGQSNGLIGADIDATDAWAINHENVTALGDTLVVAVIDGKFDITHEDINFFVNHNEVPNNGIDDDGNGYIDDVTGWNVPDANGNVQSTGFSANHGTHVSGTIGAIGNNSKGVAGVCWGVKILPIYYGSTTESNVVAAYDYAREMRILYNNTLGTQGAYVVSTNSSFGVDGGNPVDYPIWCAMFDSMGAVGILSAGATANKNWNIDDNFDIPTSCPSKWLISVTNTNRNDVRNSGAAYGKGSIDIGAPGTAVHSTYPQNTYSNSTGTSMATPHVAGTVAAMYAAACKPMMDAAWEAPDSIALLVKKYLLDGIEWNSSLNNQTRTNGRLNLHRAIQNMRLYNCDSCQFDAYFDKIPISCKNAADGALAVVVPGDYNQYTFLWSTGLNTVEAVSLSPGFYTVTVADSSGCRRFISAELHDPDSIRVNSIQVTLPANGNPGSIAITASAGNDMLSYSLNGGPYQNSPVLVVNEEGIYVIYIKSEAGCIEERQVVVSSLNDVTNHTSVKVYPNPASDVINVELSVINDTPLHAHLTDLQGRTVKTWNTALNAGLQTLSWPVDNMPKGFYLLHIHTSGNTGTTFKICIH